MRTKELRRFLKKQGCTEVRQTGSHLIVRCKNGCQTVIPIHAGDINSNTLRSIEKQLEDCLGKGWLQ